MGMKVVHEAQRLAEAWAEADDKLRTAEANLQHAQTEVDIVRRIREDAAGRLADRVGRNVPTKVFRVGADAVIVEYERGIKRVPVEASE